MSFLHFPCEISLKRRSNFSLWFAFMHFPGIQGLFNILMSLTICTSFGFQMQKSLLPDILQPFWTSETMVSNPNSERKGNGPKHRSVRKGANEEGKQTYQIQSYIIFWHFRLTVALFNWDIPVFTG